MVSVFFYCSSPYIGYTLRQADYVNKEMKKVSSADMTAIGYKLFNSSGSYMILGSFEGRMYFHSRQSQSENFDEQGRRIYTNIAFVGSNSKDDKTIKKIAMYVMFNEEAFYKKVADMITLLDDGFTVDFNKLKAFVDQMERTGAVFKSANKGAIKFYNDVMSHSAAQLGFVITESTWSYLVKQVGYDFNDSVLYKLTPAQAQSLTQSGTFELRNNSDSTKPSPSEQISRNTEETEAPMDVEIAEASNTSNSDALDIKDSEIERLKEDLNNICAERNELESDLRKLNNKLSALEKEYNDLKNKQKKCAVMNVAIGAVGTLIIALIINILKLIF